MSRRVRKWFEDRNLPCPWFAAGDAPRDWRPLFEGRSSEILPRLMEGDPMSFLPLSALVSSEEAMLLHPERVAARTLAVAAHRGALEGNGHPEWIGWMRGCAVDAIQQLSDEDAFEESRGRPPLPEEAHEYEQLFPPESGIPRRWCRLASVEFNRKALLDRVPFYRCIVEGWSLQDTAADLLVEPKEVRERLERVLGDLIAFVARADEQRGGERR